MRVGDGENGWDDVPYIGGEAREALELLMDEQNLPGPDEWSSFDVNMDTSSGAVEVIITADDGTEYEISLQTDLEDLDDWDWAWDLWDWLIENYPDVDLDSKYAATAS